MVNAIELTVEQWNSLKTEYKGTSYGASVQFFDNPEDILTAKKIVTLNGSPLRASGNRIKSSIEDRLKGSNVIAKIPDGVMSGKFVVVSNTAMKNANIKTSSNLNVNNL